MPKSEVRVLVQPEKLGRDKGDTSFKIILTLQKCYKRRTKNSQKPCIVFFFLSLYYSYFLAVLSTYMLLFSEIFENRIPVSLCILRGFILYILSNGSFLTQDMSLGNDTSVSHSRCQLWKMSFSVVLLWVQDRPHGYTL